MLDIRLATLEDMDDILAMGVEMYEESPYAAIRPVDLDSFRRYAEDLIANHYFLVALKNGEAVGMAASYIATLPIHCDIMVAAEVVFYVRPAFRGSSAAVRLAMELEDVVRKAEDVDVYTFSAMASSPPVVDKLFRRMGYKPIETAYIKEAQWQQ
jgi:N-acetylglutamate synthase-like GNAT family acetyltransferase